MGMKALAWSPLQVLPVCMASSLVASPPPFDDSCFQRSSTCRWPSLALCHVMSSLICGLWIVTGQWPDISRSECWVSEFHSLFVSQVLQDFHPSSNAWSIFRNREDNDNTWKDSDYPPDLPKKRDAAWWLGEGHGLVCSNGWRRVALDMEHFHLMNRHVDSGFSETGKRKNRKERPIESPNEVWFFKSRLIVTFSGEKNFLIQGQVR